MIENLLYLLPVIVVALYAAFDTATTRHRLHEDRDFAQMIRRRLFDE